MPTKGSRGQKTRKFANVLDGWSQTTFYLQSLVVLYYYPTYIVNSFKFHQIVLVMVYTIQLCKGILMVPVLYKVNSVQKGCAKCFAVHILKFEILQITLKKLNKEHLTLSFQFFINKSSILIFFCLCFFLSFARYQILICEPQSIWHNLLILS